MAGIKSKASQEIYAATSAAATKLPLQPTILYQPPHFHQKTGLFNSLSSEFWLNFQGKNRRIK